MRALFISFLLFLSFSLKVFADTPVVRVGSKSFPENYILAELVAQIIESVGEAKVERKFGFSGTGLVFTAIESGEIDIYPEYTGTFTNVMLKRKDLTKHVDIQKAALEKYDLVMSKPLGFNNTYAMAIREEVAKKYKIKKISDLKGKPFIRYSLTHEFDKRDDGWGPLTLAYGIDSPNLRLMIHALSYEAIEHKETDVIDAYSTDAKILKYNLRVLEDDKNFFPSYFGVFLARSDFVKKYPKTWKKLKELEFQISNERMVKLNAMAELEKLSFEEVVAAFLKKQMPSVHSKRYSFLYLRTKEHFVLVFVSLIAAIIVGVPLGLIAYKFKWIGQITLIFSGLLQTIPSLALLCLFIPIFGANQLTALVALLVYGLLPIVRNTHSGLTSIQRSLIESAQSLGMGKYYLMTKVELPLALPAILTGIKTTAIINVGMATLAGFIGAGGYGQAIVTGLSLNDLNMTLIHGALPAAVFAFVLHILFEILSRILIPRGLKV